jgi:uncharacterized protein
MRARSYLSVFLMALVLGISPVTQAQIIPLDPPGQEDFILDRAGLLNAEDAAHVREISGQLLAEMAIPIIVVTIESMAQYGGPDMRIETFATLLFNQWGIGHEEVDGRSWNRGILLLVSEGDRKARIELGADWGRDHDQTSSEIMEDHLIPHFRNGQYSAGIVAGVEGLNSMARGLALPPRPVEWWMYALVVGLIALAIFTAISLLRSGAGGWAWVLWAAIFGILGFILYNAMTAQSSGGGGGGGSFSGGSFGGGFSGGGGATGSW